MTEHEGQGCDSAWLPIPFVIFGLKIYILINTYLYIFTSLYCYIHEYGGFLCSFERPVQASYPPLLNRFEFFLNSIIFEVSSFLSFVKPQQYYQSFLIGVGTPLAEPQSGSAPVQPLHWLCDLSGGAHKSAFGTLSGDNFVTLRPRLGTTS